ncbi:type II and III secretion system protein family protein [Gluconacetobacter takamatsuzukensis]|uniref:Type II and III secretion system protein family protein n=1 Tax=Gluconacetobacter takamatsuzukensis TaxID=1286190 RepID=A0A7W4KDG2_9PROT|nr:type II and III secretion system protein family protein [Gluconacetobacter takamatsuzukensis]MBB2204795.1 type II and III secretion system protein family protein [Gluconacetobacter takamatsuzukensis]
MSSFKKGIAHAAGAILMVAVALWAPSLRAEPGSSAAVAPEASIVLAAGTGRMIQLPQEAGSLFSADPKVAEVRSASPHSMFVFGVGPGNTTIEASSPEGELVARYVVRIMPASYDASFLRQNEAPASPDVRIASSPDGLNLDGQARDPQAAQKLTEKAKALAANKDGYVADYMTVPGSLQVNLRVQIVEMARSLVRELGVEWQNVNALGTSAAIGVATQSPLATMADIQNSMGFLSRFNIGHQKVTLETVVDALAQDNLIHSLAEPNLTTISGHPASFLAGGEYPIPTSSYGGTTNVTFKRYGIGLDFLPTVLADGRINMRVRPEVSALTTAGAVTLQNGNSSVQIPAITVRRADTMVELGSGQSFAIAGLLSDDTKINSTGLPWLSDIPVLGALFKSSSFQKDETELVIIVTPYLVKPVNNVRELHRPDDGWTPPNDMERMFLMRQSGTNVHRRRPWQTMDVGDAGFMVE